MKNYNNFSSTFWLSILILIGGVGSIIFSLYPRFGGILIVIGVIGSIYSFISSDLSKKDTQELLETQAIMMARGGIGNVYLEHLRREVKRNGFCRTTIDFLSKALELNPNDESALEMLSSALTLQLSFQTWLENRKNIIESDTIYNIRQIAKRGLKVNPNNDSFYTILGILRDLEGKHVKARHWFKRSSEFRTDPYWRLSMSTSWGMSGNYLKALEQIELAVREGARRWIVDYYRGRTLVSLARYEKATFYLEKAYHANPYRPEVLQSYQEAYYMQGLFIKAAFLNLRLFLLLFFLKPKRSLKHVVEAIKLCSLASICRIAKWIWVIFKHLPWLANLQARMLPPDEPESSLAEIMVRQKHFGEAAISYKKSLASYPKRIGNLNNLAMCLVKLGKCEEALEILDKALLIDPNDKIIVSNKIGIQKGWINSKESKLLWVDQKQNLLKEERAY